MWFVCEASYRHGWRNLPQSQYLFIFNVLFICLFYFSVHVFFNWFLSSVWCQNILVSISKPSQGKYRLRYPPYSLKLSLFLWVFHCGGFVYEELGFSPCFFFLERWGSVVHFYIWFSAYLSNFPPSIMIFEFLCLRYVYASIYGFLINDFIQ